MLLNPNTGKPVTWYEELAAWGGGFAGHATFIASCEEYTRQVFESGKIDQTPPFSFRLKHVFYLIAAIVLIYQFIFKPLKK